MLTGKQKRYLRSLGMDLEPVIMVGKEGVTMAVVRQAVDALRARELIKGRALQSTPEEPAGIAYAIAEASEAVVVQVIGRNFLLYKPNDEQQKVQLPE